MGSCAQSITPGLTLLSGSTGVFPTIEELGTLGVAVLHLFTFVRSRLHVAVSGGEHRRPRLYKELTQLNVVAGGSTMQGGPTEGTREGLNWSGTQSASMNANSCTGFTSHHCQQRWH